MVRRSWVSQFEISSVIKMHCLVSGLINLLSRILYIVLDPVINVSRIYVLHVNGEHNGLQKQYCVIHVMQKYIITAVGCCWVILKMKYLQANGSVDPVLRDFFHSTTLRMIMILWNVSRLCHILLALQLYCRILWRYSIHLISVRMIMRSLNIMVI